MAREFLDLLRTGVEFEIRTTVLDEGQGVRLELTIETNPPHVGALQFRIKDLERGGRHQELLLEELLTRATAKVRQLQLDDMLARRE